jgi:hypothetical protein
MVSAPRPGQPLVVLAFLFASAASVQAQAATEIEVSCRAGQTFLTWRESSAANVHYRIYRDIRPIRSAADLDAADFLGEVNDRTSRNQGRSLANGHEYQWVIADGGAPLDANQGLFVYTVEASGKSHYAVTSVQGGVENRTLLVGANTTATALDELPAPPEPVVQAVDSMGTLYGHWVGDRDTPFQPALSILPSQGFDFRLDPGSTPGPRGLVVRLHAAGQTYSQGWPARFETPGDVDILALSDLLPYTGWSFWFGSQEDLPGAPTSETRVWQYTTERAFWTLDWAAQHLGTSHDPERVYVVGGSMGAIGGTYLLTEHPERFAAALLRNGLYDLLATDYRNTAIFQALFGSFGLDLAMRSGLSVWLRTNAAYMATRDPGLDWPVIRTISGRMDGTVGWSSFVELAGALQQAGRPAIHYFDDRDHSPRGYWQPLERALLTRTFAIRRDRPQLRFDGCTLDDRIGSGDPLDGDLLGAVGAYVDYDPASASATASELRFDVALREEGALDDAPAPNGWARLVPRRTAPFVLGAQDMVHFQLWQGALLRDEHWLVPDADGLVTTPLVPVSLYSREARFVREVLPTQPTALVGPELHASDEYQALLAGPPDADWTVALVLGDESGPTGIGTASVQLNGTLDARGVTDLRFPLPSWLQPGQYVWTRTRIDGVLSDWIPAIVRAGRGAL